MWHGTMYGIVSGTVCNNDAILYGSDEETIHAIDDQIDVMITHIQWGYWTSEQKNAFPRIAETFKDASVVSYRGFIHRNIINKHGLELWRHYLEGAENTHVPSHSPNTL